MESPCSDGPVLHIAVVGFHHKKGCQLEFSYPPLVPGAAHDSSDLPDEWKYLPFLALPDGAHNHQEDTVYFNLPPLSGHQRCVHCVSCYRQMEAKALKVREADVTRETVQKSVCVLSRAPLYGLIQAKLQLITHAYFEEKDFSQISILKELYEHMNRSLSCTTLDGSQLYLGLSARDLILHFKHKVLVLFKLILLEKRILFHVTPVKRLVETLMSVLSLFPGMIQHGLSESATYQPRHSVSEEAGSPGPPSSCEEEEPGQADAFGPVTVQPQSSCAQEDRFGLPLAIFTKGYLCLPYMALQQHHLLSDLSVRGFVAGATNVLFRQQTHLSDAVVEVDEARILICDPELRRSLALSTADLRFADYLLKHVTENKQDVFLDGTGWEGGDEWIRAQFNLYLHSLLSSALQPDRERLLSDYGGSFSAAWTVTHNYRLWISNKHPAMTEIAAGHPFQGQYSVADVKIRLAHSVQNSDRGKKLGNAVVSTSRSVVQTGRVVGQSVGGALTVAKSTMSSWLGLQAPPPQASD